MRRRPSATQFTFAILLAAFFFASHWLCRHLLPAWLEVGTRALLRAVPGDLRGGPLDLHWEAEGVVPVAAPQSRARGSLTEEALARVLPVRVVPAQDLRIQIKVLELPLEPLSPWLRRWLPDAPDLVGRIGGSIEFRDADAAPQLELDLSVNNLATRAPGGRTPTASKLFSLDLRGTFTWQGDVLHASGLTLRSGTVVSSGHLSVRLPLREDSPVSFHSRFDPLTFDALFAAAGRPASLRGTVNRLALNAMQVEWRQLRSWLQKPAGMWPKGLTAAAELMDVTIPVVAKEPLTGVRAALHIDHRKLEVRGAQGHRAGHPLPTLDLRLHDWRQLAHNIRKAPLASYAPPLPGVWPALAWLREEIDSAIEEAVHPSIELSLDWVEHPALLWRLEAVSASLTPSAESLGIAFERGTWGGVPISGRGVLEDRGQAMHLDLELTVHHSTGRAHSRGPVTPVPPPSPAEAVAAPSPDPLAPGSTWAAGYCTIAPNLPQRAEGEGVRFRFRAAGADVNLSGLELALESGGDLVGSARLDLSRDDAVPFLAAFQLTGTSLSAVLDALGFETHSAPGELVLAAGIRGRLRAGEALRHSLEGPLSLHARNGEIHERLSLALALAAVSETLNPFRSREILPYDAIDAELELARGVLNVRSFRLHGPSLRLVGTGEIQLTDPSLPVDGMLGVFFFRGLDTVVEMLPLLNRLLLGKDESLTPAYFRVTGSFLDPEMDLIPIKSFASGPASILFEGLPDFLLSNLKRIWNLFWPGSGAAPPEAAEGEAGETEAGAAATGVETEPLRAPTAPSEQTPAGATGPGPGTREATPEAYREPERRAEEPPDAASGASP